MGKEVQKTLLYPYFNRKGSFKMNMFEKARSIKDMLQMGSMTQDKLAAILGVSQSYIANKIRLLSFSKKAEDKIIEYSLSERHARSILRLKSEEEQLKAIEKAHAMKMNVQRCEILVDTMLDSAIRNTSAAGTNYADKIGHFEASLESSLSLLRQSGIRARAKREEEGNMIYFSITIG